MKNIRIVFIDYFAYALFDPNYPITYGGAQIQLYQIEQALAAQSSYDIHVICKNFGQPKLKLFGRITTHTFPHHIPNWLAPIPHLRALPPTFRLLRLIYSIKPDIVIVRGACPEVGLAGWFARLTHKKFIYMIAHEWDVTGEYIRRHGYVGKLYDYGLRAANIIIAQNHEQVDAIAQRYFKKAVLIRSVYEIPSHILPFSQRQSILWVARLERWKNPELFIEIVRAFPHEHFIAIAPDGSESAAWTQKIKQSLKNCSNLDFIPSVPFAQIDPYFRRAKLFINTSQYEGFPNTFVQAAKNGTPIISYRVNPDSIFEKWKIGINSHGSTTKMIRGVNKLLTHSTIWRKASKQGHRYAQHTHDIKTISKQYQKLLAALV